MKKNFTLFKVLLVALGLLGGVNCAWATDVPYNVGESTSATYLSAYSDVWEMTSDGTLDVTFTNHCGTGSFWENWHLICGNSSDSPTVGDNNANRYFVMRADRWDNVAGNANNFIDVSANYFTDFMTYQNEAIVNLKITRTGTTVTVYTTVTKNSESRTMTFYKIGIPKDETIKFYLTGSLSYLTVTSQTQGTDVKGVVNTNAWFPFTGASIVSQSVAGEIAVMQWSSQWTATPSIDSDMFRVGNMSDGVVTLVGDAAGEKDIVTITFDLGLVQLSGREVQFKVVDTDNHTLIDEQFNAYNSQILANTLGFALSEFTSAKSDNPGMSAAKNSFTLTLNYATRKMTGVVNNGEVHTVDMPDNAEAVASFVIRSNYNNANRRCYLDNLRITTTIGDYSVEDANYVVKFVDEDGNEVKDEIIRSGAPGSTISATTGDKEAFFNTAGTMKYFYKSDDSEGKTIASNGSTVLTITYREAETYNYTVKSSLGTTIKSASVFEGESVTVPYPTFILSEGKLYRSNASDDSGKKFSKTFVVSSNNQEETISYTENISNVVFYAEGEDVSGATWTNGSNASVRASMCAAGYNGTDENIVVTTLSETGQYRMTISTYGTKGSYTFEFKAGDRGVVTAEYPGTNGPTYSGDFIILGSTDIIWPATDDKHFIDYIYIEKLSAEATVSATIGSTGYTTFSSSYPLDLTGIEAYYIASVESDKAMLTKATTATGTVAAGTGLILAGTAGDVISIPVADLGEEIDGNLLVGCPTATEVTTPNANAYVLVNNDGAEFQPLSGNYKDNKVTIPAGKAYLYTNANGANLRVVFAGDATGIANIEAAKTENGAMFNMAGQRVDGSYKGIVIKNGKKVWVK